MHKAADLRDTDQAVIGLNFEQAHRGSHRLFEEWRGDSDILQFNDFYIGYLHRRSPSLMNAMLHRALELSLEFAGTKSSIAVPRAGEIQHRCVILFETEQKLSVPRP